MSVSQRKNARGPRLQFVAVSGIAGRVRRGFQPYATQETRGPSVFKQSVVVYEVSTKM